MARIRTIKPEFFTSEDIVCLSPLARLLYIALWCEADREGRFAWKPRTFKLRYLPADDCDIEALCAEILALGIVRLYGDGLAYIPSFTSHQHVNPRESQSDLPEPSKDDACRRVPTRADASNLDMHAQGGKEGKGKERKESKEDASERDASPRAPRKTKPKEPRLTDWLASLGDADAVPADDPLFEWAERQGIPADWLGYAWAAFEDRYADKAKTYTDWRAAFRDHVKRGWLDIWRHDTRTGSYVLTTAGEQWRREASA